MEKAKKQIKQATRGNSNIIKEDFTRNHKKSKLKNVIDPRVVEINILLSHERRGCLNKTIEMHQLELMRSRWERDGYTLTVIN